MKFKLALITGASSGIGAEYARQLAARGTDVILVARNEAKLKAIAAELVERHGVIAEPLVADLATASGIGKAASMLENHREIDLLINNAGFGVPGPFHESNIRRQLDMLKVHIEAVNRLTRAALPGMVKRRYGAVINVSSIAGFGPGPGSVNYSATKAYLIRFSQSLALEMKPHGVVVQGFCPGFTHTGFHDTPDLKDNFDKGSLPGFLWSSAETTVARSLSALDENHVIVLPNLKYRFIAWLLGSKLYFWLAKQLASKKKK